MGGDEEPCQPASLLRVIEEETGHPCPYRESYNADDVVCLELLAVATSSTVSTMYQAWQALLLQQVEAEHQLRLMRRVAAAAGDARIAGRLPKRGLV